MVEQSSNQENMENPATGLGGIKPGLEIGNFVLEKKLGEGGMGEVWLANQKAMDRKVAIKLLSPVFTKDSNFVNRFMKEVRMSGKLEHTNIVTAHDAGIDEGIYYLAMSYVEGSDLNDMFKENGPIDEKEALSIAKSIAGALEYAWDTHKILHRDIKPSNIMVDSTGEPKLMDMGISKSLSEDSSMTMTGMIVGTQHYISLEQAQNDSSMDFRADVYSLGATLYHIIVGVLPYEASTSMGILSKLISEPLPSPLEKNPKISPQCAALLEIMMSKDMTSRQASWREVIEDIDRVLNDEFPLTPVPEGENKSIIEERAKSAITKKTAGSSNRTLYIAVAACAVFIGILIGVIQFLPNKDDSRKQPGSVDNTSSNRDNPDNNVFDVSESGKSSVTEGEPAKVAPLTSVKQVPVKDDMEAANDIWDFAIEAEKKAKSSKEGFSQAISNFEKIKRNYVGTKYELMADEQITELIKSRQKEAEKVLKKLTENAKNLARLKNFDKAIEFVTNYEGPMAEFTQPQRTLLADKYLNAPEKMSGLMEEVALLIIRGSYRESCALIRKERDLEEFYSPEMKKLREIAEAVKKSSIENFSNADSLNGEIGALCCGLGLMLKEDSEGAFKQFKQVKSIPILAVFERTKAERLEKRATIGLKKVMLMAAIAPKDITLHSVLDQLKSRKLTVEQAKRLLSGLEVYKKKFTGTKFVAEKAEIIEFLESSAKAASYQRAKTLLPKETDDAIGNISEATDSALDLLLTPDKDDK